MPIQEPPSTGEKTPVRQNAEEKQRLKEEVVLQSTPGWRSDERTKLKRLPKEPEQLKSYLKELSSVLVNLSDTYEAPDSGNDRLEVEGIVDGDKSRVLNLSQDVFSSLRGYNERKIRRLNSSAPIVIDKNEESKVGLSLRSSASEHGLLDIGKQAIYDVENDLELNAISSYSYSDEDGDDDDDNYSGGMGNSRNETGIDATSTKSDLNGEGVQPLPMAVLKGLVATTINKENYSLPRESLKIFQELSLSLLESVARELKYLTKEGHSSVLDRSMLLQIYENHHLRYHGTLTNKDLFRLCQQHLPLEALNSIEIALFGNQ
ncbi:centromere-binding protein CNN1 Ecym_2588 [Eremothecium cymbalariae DBVPG|uniref:CENP-T/Histone H4 histone fold domain-containing protein n=1 Tax=Eremothecium cymbalariae (strain CBS 270.75 / DBVPG 7215 / KCTC 17166 / NRRL Y-17582) TaxID=931890 RepID=G8JQH0_ERECY|nr:Hypothetical protein Ecym_2588 [Eremothecium cymbalariae DBVPG\